MDRQGPDVGPRYRSMVFVTGEAQRRIATALIDSLRVHRTFAAPIATEITGLRTFRIAEDFHQDYVAHHPRAAYVVINDLSSSSLGVMTWMARGTAFLRSFARL